MYYSNFLYIERGYERTLWLIPGWAFDFRIFFPLMLPFNYLFFTGSIITDFKIDFITNVIHRLNLKKISILAWSMGGTFVCHNLSKLINKIPIDEIILCNTARLFPSGMLEELKIKLSNDKTLTLQDFYKLVFFKHKLHRRWFEKDLLHLYLKKFTLKELEEGLNYLSTEITFPNKTDMTCKIIYGIDDLIVQKDMHINPDDFNNTHPIYYIDSGHISFFSKEFISCIL